MFKLILALVTCVVFTAFSGTTPKVSKKPEVVTFIQKASPGTTVAKKAVIILSYAQKVKEVEKIHAQQVATLQKTKDANLAAIANLTAANQRIEAKEDSLVEASKNQLQNIFDTEMRKIESAQSSIEKRKADAEQIHTDALSGFSK